MLGDGEKTPPPAKQRNFVALPCTVASPSDLVSREARLGSPRSNARHERRRKRESSRTETKPGEGWRNKCVGLFSCPVAFFSVVVTLGEREEKKKTEKRQNLKKKTSRILLPPSPLCLLAPVSKTAAAAAAPYNGDDGPRRLEGPVRVVDEAPGRPAGSRLFRGAESDERRGQEMVSQEGFALPLLRLEFEKLVL